MYAHQDLHKKQDQETVHVASTDAWQSPHELLSFGLGLLLLHSHTILDWATCGKCLKPRCFKVLVSDFHLASLQNFSGA